MRTALPRPSGSMRRNSSCSRRPWAIQKRDRGSNMRAPAHRLVDIAEVGRVVSFLVGGAASGMTGDTIYVDPSLHIIA
ncbi:MAG TPA: SDR family oxidoreductase [Acetobacteraceae bacterium]|nr:SDR family oxidoreductase [Acetobacteraceae bacterium]